MSSSGDEVDWWRASEVSELNEAMVLINLLENQREIYRTCIEKCCCEASKSFSDKLAKLNTKIEHVYGQSKSFNKKFTKRGGSLLSERVLANFLPKEFLNRQVSQEQFVSVNLPQEFSKRIGNLKKRFNCAYQSSCRFVGFDERSLLHHHLSHFREEFVAIIEPHGYKLDVARGQVLVNEQAKRNALVKCFFPGCAYHFEYPSEDSNILAHLNCHCSSYLLFPCYNCLKTFERVEDLAGHIKQNQSCREKNEIQFNNRYKFDFSIVADDASDDLPKVNCPDCSHNIPEALYKLHCKFFHSNDDGAERMDIGDNEDNNNENINKTKKRKLLKEHSMLRSHQMEHLYNQIPPNEAEASDDHQLMCMDNNNNDENNQQDDDNIVINQYNIINEDGHNYMLVPGDNNNDKFVIIDPYNDFSDIFFEPNSLENIENLDLEQPQLAEQTQVMIMIDGEDVLQPPSSADPNEIIITTEEEEQEVAATSTFIPPPAENQPQEVDNVLEYCGAHLFACQTCNLSFAHENLLSSHRHTAHQEQSYLCKHCGFVTQDIQLFYKHEEEPHNLAPTTTTTSKPQPVEHSENFCHFCTPPKLFSASQALKRHYLNFHTPVTCEVCADVLPNKSEMRVHMNNHYKNSEHGLCFSCDQCSYKTFSKEGYDKHKQTHDKSQCCPYEGCADYFVDPLRLDAHINRCHRNAQPHKCPECGEGFYNAIKMVEHQQSSHNPAVMHKCKHCNFETPSDACLKEHSESEHQNEGKVKSHKCTECNKYYTTPSLLKTHYRNTHLMFPCAKCQNSFRGRDAFKVHKATNCGQNGNELTCSGCSKAFKKFVYLQKHQRICGKNVESNLAKQPRQK